MNKHKVIVATLLGVIGHFTLLAITKSPEACLFFWIFALVQGYFVDRYWRRTYGIGLLE